MPERLGTAPVNDYAEAARARTSECGDLKNSLRELELHFSGGISSAPQETSRQAIRKGFRVWKLGLDAGRGAERAGPYHLASDQRLLLAQEVLEG